MAQPVAAVTSCMPSSVPPPPQSSSTLLSSPKSQSSMPSTFHGATLPLFTSISMAPHYLVAFSLRVPSRMASTLADLSSATAAPSSPVHMVINLLAAPQAHAAIIFSRPDLHPRPFENPSIQWSLSPDCLPILHGPLSALSCRVVGAPLPLDDPAVLGDKLPHKSERVDADGVESELFIAQVVRVEDVPRLSDVGYDDSIRTLPPVYPRRDFTTTSESEVRQLKK